MSTAEKIPWELRAIGAEEVGELLGLAPRTVLEKVACRPDFHDSRAEAIWRLSKKLDVMELARMIGHRDIRSLMFYYNADPGELADRL